MCRKEFLEENIYIDFSNDIIKFKAKELFAEGMTDVEKVRSAYEFVRDEIKHSFDCNADVVTAKASDVIKYKTGICHAKANLLAALLRSEGIPVGFCYQRLTLLDDDSKGYCLHGLNAVHLDGKWVHLDARGNKEGINAQFSLDEEKLAFSVREQYDEVFYEGVYPSPHLQTMELLENGTNINYVFENFPDNL